MTPFKSMMNKLHSITPEVIMETFTDLWQRLFGIAGVFLSVVLCAFWLILLSGWLLHRSRCKALRQEKNKK